MDGWMDGLLTRFLLLKIAAIFYKLNTDEQEWAGPRLPTYCTHVRNPSLGAIL